MDIFKFIQDIDTYNELHSFTAIISSKINTKEELLKELGEKLNFPDYYGLNWDALEDCLNDLDWIKESRIVLIHKTLPKLEENIFKTYIDILSETVNRWKESKTHEFVVIFPEGSQGTFKYFID